MTHNASVAAGPGYMMYEPQLGRVGLRKNRLPPEQTIDRQVFGITYCV